MKSVTSRPSHGQSQDRTQPPVTWANSGPANCKMAGSEDGEETKLNLNSVEVAVIGAGLSGTYIYFTYIYFI